MVGVLLIFCFPNCMSNYLTLDFSTQTRSSTTTVLDTTYRDAKERLGDNIPNVTPTMTSGVQQKWIRSIDITSIYDDTHNSLYLNLYHMQQMYF